jgi:hypothetical protein
LQRQNAGSSPWWRQDKQRKIKVSSSKLEKLEHLVSDTLFTFNSQDGYRFYVRPW